jgi:hypothetical protein
MGVHVHCIGTEVLRLREVPMSRLEPMATLVDPDALQAPAVALKEAIRRDRDLLDKVHTASMSMNICACAHAAACALCACCRVCVCVFTLLPLCVSACVYACCRHVYFGGGECVLHPQCAAWPMQGGCGCWEGSRACERSSPLCVRTRSMCVAICSGYATWTIRGSSAPLACFAYVLTHRHTRAYRYTRTRTHTDRHRQTIARQAIVTATMTWPGWRAHADKGGGWVGCSCRACPSCVRSMWPCRPTPWTYAHPAPNRCGCGCVCVCMWVWVCVWVWVGGCVWVWVWVGG